MQNQLTAKALHEKRGDYKNSDNSLFLHLMLAHMQLRIIVLSLPTPHWYVANSYQDYTHSLSGNRH